MVSVTKRNQSSTAPGFLVVLVLVFGTIFHVTSNSNFVAVEVSTTTIHNVLHDDPNARTMRQWKNQLLSSCSTFLGTIHGNITEQHLTTKRELEAQALSKLQIPRSESLPTKNLDATNNNYNYNRVDYPICSHVFMDLGTNRGDSIACAVDASLDVCSRPFVQKDPSLVKAVRMSKEFPRLHLEVVGDDLQIVSSGGQGQSLLRMLQDFFAGPGMESVCVYGMEGNPYFTSSLQQLNAFVSHMEPRPLKHLHIHTDMIVTSTDGPATLFIDQYSEEHHFWGSSVLQSMPDIRRTSKQNNGTVVQANVIGMTLSSLIAKTAMRGNNIRPAGGSLLVKMDVEGAEFGVLKEAATSGVLCDYVKHGNNATLVVEFHQHLIKDATEKQQAVAGLKEAKETLRECGVKFRQLPNFWT
eukprot:Nitzschia sp. Nitz4//scaffold133_size116822//93328//94563//NITZ4_003819-RA/size116822-processed-gene-0.66-mRNA-1//-1//CDS//3329535432//3299//frame0